MSNHNSLNLGIQGPAFAVEVSGSLLGGVEVNTGLLAALVQAIATVSSEPVKKMIIHFKAMSAEIEVVQDRISRQVRIEKFHTIAELYNKALFDSDGIWYYTPDMKQEYQNMLRQDYTQQFMRLLHSD